MRGVASSGGSRSPSTREWPPGPGPAAAALLLSTASRARGRPGAGPTAVGTAGSWGRGGLEVVRSDGRVGATT
jgi:hypothetical protein